MARPGCLRKAKMARITSANFDETYNSYELIIFQELLKASSKFEQDSLFYRSK